MAGKNSLLGDRLFLKSAIVNMTQFPMKGTNNVHKTLFGGLGLLKKPRKITTINISQPMIE